MTNQTSPVSPAPDSTPTLASRFISNEVSKFSRSHTRLYLALILDVIHAHAAIQPKGYASMLETLAPHMPMLPKYCTVINPALASTHAQTLSSFPATNDGLSKAVAWLENQSSLQGYTLSLEDTKRFFQGKWSVKAQAQAAKDAADTLQAERTAAAALKASENEAKAVQETNESNAREEGSNKRSKAIQSKLESVITMTPRPAGTDVAPLAGPVLHDGWQTTMICVHEKGDSVKLTGLDTLSAEAIMSMMEFLNTHMLAMLDAQAAATLKVA